MKVFLVQFALYCIQTKVYFTLAGTDSFSKYSQNSYTSKAHVRHVKITQKSTPPVCYNCGISGHVSRQCKNIRIEYTRSKQLGHLRDRWPFAKAHAINQFNVIGNIVYNPYLKTTHINGCKDYCLLDRYWKFRYTYTILLPGKLKLSINKTNTKKPTGFTGERVLSIKCVDVNIRIMSAIAKVHAIAVNDNQLT